MSVMESTRKEQAASVCQGMSAYIDDPAGDLSLIHLLTSESTIKRLIETYSRTEVERALWEMNNDHHKGGKP